MFYRRQICRKSSVLQNFKSRKISSIETFKLRKKKLSQRSFNQENFDSSSYCSTLNKSLFASKQERTNFAINNSIQINLSENFYERILSNTCLQKDVFKKCQNQKLKQLEPFKKLQIFHKIVKQNKKKIQQNQISDQNDLKMIQKCQKQSRFKKNKNNYSHSLMACLKRPKISISEHQSLSKPRSQSVQRNSPIQQFEFRQSFVDKFRLEKTKNRSASQGYRDKMKGIINSCRKLQIDKSIKHSLSIFQRFSKQMDVKLEKKSFGFKKFLSIEHQE